MYLPDEIPVPGIAKIGTFLINGLIYYVKIPVQMTYQNYPLIVFIN